MNNDKDFVAIFSNGSDMRIVDGKVMGRSDFEGRIEDELKLQYVSREQVKFYLENGNLQIEELPSSKNGTWLISGGKVEKLEKGKRYKVNPGDEINFSKSVTVKIEEQ